MGNTQNGARERVEGDERGIGTRRDDPTNRRQWKEGWRGKRETHQNCESTASVGEYRHLVRT